MERPHLYILEGKKPKPISDILKWAEWFEKANRVVKGTIIQGVHISTVFLGLDHSYFPDSDPVLFETMVFGSDEFADYQERYRTWEEAEAGHQKACELVCGIDV